MTATAPRTREQMADRVAGCIEAGDLRQALEASQDLNRHHPDYAYGLVPRELVAAQDAAPARRAADDRSRAAARAFRPVPAAPRALPARSRRHGGCGRCRRRAAGPTPGRRRAPRRDSAHCCTGWAIMRARWSITPPPSNSTSVNPEFHFNRAAVRRYLGDAVGAEQDFDAAIALRPDEYEAYNGRAQLRKQTAAHNHVAQLRDTIGRTRSPAGLVQLHFALAKELEDIEDHPASFESLRQGADAQALADALRRRYRSRHHRPDPRGLHGRSFRRPRRGVRQCGGDLRDRHAAHRHHAGRANPRQSSGRLRRGRTERVRTRADAAGVGAGCGSSAVATGFCRLVDARGFQGTGSALPRARATVSRRPARVHRQAAVQLPLCRVDPPGVAPREDRERPARSARHVLRGVQAVVQGCVPVFIRPGRSSAGITSPTIA